MIKRVISKLLYFIGWLIGKPSLWFYRARNHNKSPIIISRDCVGGLVYHQLGLKFCSPTINLFFSLKDFNLFCSHLDDYLKGELFEIKGKLNYPVGGLRPLSNSTPTVTIYFKHYNSFNDATSAWKRRAERCIKLLNLSNIFIINTCAYEWDSAHVDDEIINGFNSITYKKVVIVDKKYGFEDEYIIKPTDNANSAYLLNRTKLSWRRVFNDFDFVSFLN